MRERSWTQSWRLAEGFVQANPLGPIPVKGMAEMVEIFELTGAGPARKRLHAAAARGLTRFVGREPELEALFQALDRAGTGQGQVVALVGEAGVGKSRLVWKLTHSHRTQGWLILESGSVSYGKAMAYLPVLDILKTYFQIETRDDARKIREKVTGKILTLDRALEPFLAAFLAILDAPLDGLEWQTLDSTQRRQRILEGIKRLILRESQVQPVLLVFEDLHWIDSETQGFLDSLVEGLPTSQILLLTNFRPEYQHGWGGQELLHPAKNQSAARRECPGPTRSPPRRGPEPSTTEATLDRTHPGEPLLSGGECPDPRRDQGLDR